MSPPTSLKSSVARDVLSASTPPSRPARGRPTFQPGTVLVTSCGLSTTKMAIEEVSLRKNTFRMNKLIHLLLPDHHPEVCHRVGGRGLRGHKLWRVSRHLFNATGVDVVILEISKI